MKMLHFTVYRNLCKKILLQLINMMNIINIVRATYKKACMKISDLKTNIRLRIPNNEIR